MTTPHLSLARPAGRMHGIPDVVVLGALPDGIPLVATARLLGDRIDTRNLAEDAEVRGAASRAGLVFVFRYGVAVIIGPARGDSGPLDLALQFHITEPTSLRETESARLDVHARDEDRIGPDSRILLTGSNPERLMLVAIVLARSVLLARDELLVSEAFDSIRPLVADLDENGQARSSIRDVMRLVGQVLSARHRVMGAVRADERPDILWDHPELDRLYARLEAEYELNERAAILESRFVALGDFAEVLLDIVQDKRAFRLELAIIALIALEILLTIFGMLRG